MSETAMQDMDVAALGEWADKGYFIREDADHVVTVCFKDKELGYFYQSTAMPEKMQGVCSRHDAKITQEEGLLHG